MSDAPPTDDVALDAEAEYEERKRALIEDAAETKKELDDKQEDALAQIGGAGIETFETVELGELEVEVKAWMPGNVTDIVQQARQIANQGGESNIRESMDTMIAALAEMTTDSTYNPEFWRVFYEQYGPEGIMLAVETVLKPASEGMNERQEALESFRSG